MSDFEFVAQPREGTGKGANRRLRRSGKIPGVLFGAGKDSTSIMLDANDVKKKLENEAVGSHVLTVQVNGAAEQAVLKELQRDPMSSRVIHMDFQRIRMSEKLSMTVPLHFLNEEACVGKKAGGIISHLMTDVDVSCLPKDLPAYIEVDVKALDIGDAVHLSELKMPEGVELVALSHDPEDIQDHPVVNVLPPAVVDLGEEEEEGVEAEAVETEAPAAEEDAE